MDVPGWPFDTPAVRAWEHKGVLCAVRRVGTPAVSSVNGYVLLPPDHPWRGSRAGDIPAMVDGARLAYAYGWGWLGFDTRHGGDPREPMWDQGRPGVFRAWSGWSLEEAVAHTEVLAERVAATASP